MRLNVELRNALKLPIITVDSRQISFQNDVMISVEFQKAETFKLTETAGLLRGGNVNIAA